MNKKHIIRRNENDYISYRECGGMKIDEKNVANFTFCVWVLNVLCAVCGMECKANMARRLVGKVIAHTFHPFLRCGSQRQIDRIKRLRAAGFV